MTTVTKPYQDFVNNIDVVDATKINAQYNALYNFLNAANIDFTNLAAAIYKSAATVNTLAYRDANGNAVFSMPLTNGQNPNLLFNPSSRLGFQGWNQAGTGGTTWNANFGNGGEGGQFLVSSSPASTATSYYESQKIPVNSSISLNLSAEITTNLQTAGPAPSVEIHAYSSTNADLGAVCSITLALGQTWTKVSASGTTPTNTAYVTVRMIYWSGSTSSATGFRKIKVEAGTIATTFSDDNTLNTQQYGSALGLAQVLSGGSKMESGSSSIVIATAGTQVDVTITFPTAFGATPLIFPILESVGSSAATYVTLQAVAKTATGFTFRGNSGIAQTLSVNWIAIGT